MTDTDTPHDPDAAGHWRAFSDLMALFHAADLGEDKAPETTAGTITHGEIRTIRREFRELRAELAGTRQRLDALTTERGIQFHETEANRWHTSEFATLADAIATEGGHLEWRAAERLVGEWTAAPTDTQQQPS